MVTIIRNCLKECLRVHELLNCSCRVLQSLKVFNSVAMFSIELDVKGIEKQDQAEGEDDANFHQDENDACKPIFKTTEMLGSAPHLAS